jgi:phosphate transport system substrate-binding protein
MAGESVMHDEFLYRLRIEPSPEFAVRLKARLDSQPPVRIRAAHPFIVRIAALTFAFAGAALALGAPWFGQAGQEVLDLVRQWMPASAPLRPLQGERASTHDAAHRDSAGGAPTKVPPSQGAPQAAFQTADALLPPSPIRSGQPPESDSTVIIDGARTVHPLTLAIADAFDRRTRVGEGISIRISGTGGGFYRFCRGEADIINANRPISVEEMQFCADAGIEYVELPIAYDVLAVIVNARNTWVDALSLMELRAMWNLAAQGKLTRWHNINAAWPDVPLHLVGPVTDATSFDYFTEAILGTPNVAREDYSHLASDELSILTVACDENALAFLRTADLAGVGSRVRAVSIIGANGQPVSPTLDHVIDATYAPLSRPLFIYVNRTAAQRRLVKNFVEFYLLNAGEFASSANFVPLTPDAYQAVLSHFRGSKTGSGLRGTRWPRVTVEGILAAEREQPLLAREPYGVRSRSANGRSRPSRQVTNTSQ